MTSVDFTPDEIRILSIPLMATMRKSEVEFAAACVVRALQLDGGSWRIIRLKEISRLMTIERDRGAEPVAGWFKNPFFDPDFASLGSGEFACLSGPEDDQAIEFTAAGIAAMRRWVVPSKVKWLSDQLDVAFAHELRVDLEIADARKRLLKICEADDEGQTLAECAALVEIECDSEYDQRVLAEERSRKLATRCAELETALRLMIERRFAPADDAERELTYRVHQAEWARAEALLEP